MAGPLARLWDRGWSRPVAASLLLVLAGCTALPGSGPISGQVVAGTGSHASSPYELVKLDSDVVSVVGKQPVPGFGHVADKSVSPQLMLGVGDVVSVTIYEAADGGLFIPGGSGSRPGNFVTLPDQNVDNAGNITVPYAGAIKAAGRSIPEIQEEIVSRLSDRAIEPQVVITLKDQQSSQVSVLGEVNAPARFAINPAGDRLLDAIARAGGPKHPGHQTLVTLQRRGKEGTVSFDELVRWPPNNVYVRGGDIVVLSRDIRSFMAFGASGQQGQFEFDAESMTLAQALGKAGGLLDDRADPAYVFLYRLEDRETLNKLGHDTARFDSAEIPTIYQANLRQPSGYFLAGNFELRNGDVLYIANAPISDIAKIFGVVRTGGQAANQIKQAF